MEHLVVRVAVLGLLVRIEVVMVLWRPVPQVKGCALSGLVLACAALDREQGILLPVPFGLYLCTQLASRVPARQILAGMAAMCVTLAIPLLAYAWWFDQVNGSFQLTTSTGAFLYSRVSTFAECSVIKPPAAERWLCISTPPAMRPGPNSYPWTPTSPLTFTPPAR